MTERVDAVSRGSTGPKDPTFRIYSSKQAKAYATSRKGYSLILFDYILGHHAATGGQLDALLDVGCGTGNATKDLAPLFSHACGCDPSEAMIIQAREEGRKSKSGEMVRFEVCPAEDLSELGLGEGTVDMITCAMSAHWFELDKFYPGAAKLLKPGGTLVMWSCGSFFCHPSTPNAALVQSHLNYLELEDLKPYWTPGNWISYNCYETFPLPWEVKDSPTGFSEAGLHRKIWNKGGAVEDTDGEFVSGTTTDLADIRTRLGTASMVTRWREANGHKAESGELEDPVEKAVKGIREALGAKEGDEAKTLLKNGMATGLVMLKRC